MNYEFSFDKKSVILVIGGCVAIGVLLFFAGYIVGIDRGQSQPVVQANSIAPGSATAGKTPDKEPPPQLPKDKPASEQEPSTPAAEAKKAAPDKATQPSAKDATETKSPDAAADDKPSPAKQAGDKPAFSVQLGAFQTEENALRLRDTLKAKGYPVFLFRVMDGDNHVWHTVRIGHYADNKEATRAAVKIATKEQISAWVRPANAF
jgi:DedD protein